MIDTHNAVAGESNKKAKRLEAELSNLKEQTERDQKDRSSHGYSEARKL
jgi:molecular chaperone GrpE (heat shock protein)